MHALSHMVHSKCIDPVYTYKLYAAAPYGSKNSAKCVDQYIQIVCGYIPQLDELVDGMKECSAIAE